MIDDLMQENFELKNFLLALIDEIKRNIFNIF